MLKYRKLTKSQILKYLESIKYEYFINFTVSVFRVIIFCMQPSILLLLFRLYIAIRISNISLALDPQYFTIPPQPHSNCISILYQFQYFIPANPIPIHFTCTTTEIPHQQPNFPPISSYILVFLHTFTRHHSQYNHLKLPRKPFRILNYSTSLLPFPSFPSPFHFALKPPN